MDFSLGEERREGMERNREIFRYAYTQSPYYQALLDEKGLTVEELMEDWSKIPIVDKKEMVCAETDIVPFQIFDSPERDQIVREISSGSTGLCLEVLWNRRDLISSMSSLWDSRKDFYEILPEDKNCDFYMYPENFEEELSEENRGLVLGFSMLDLNSRKIEEIYQIIWDYQPKWLLLQPSMAKVLADYVHKNNGKPIPSLKMIELTGEMVSQKQRRYIEEVFQCKTVELYGCAEAKAIAYECPEGHLHLMEDNVFVEIMDGEKELPEGQEGDIVITSLSNSVMPFVRYRIGDRGKICSEKCTCGHKGRILELTRGRENDMIQVEDDIDVPAYDFSFAFECLMEVMGVGLLQYQIEQTSYFSYIVSMVVKDKSILTDEQKQEQIKQFFVGSLEHDYLKDSIFTFRFRDELFQRKPTDKLRFFWSFERENDEGESGKNKIKK